MVQFVPMAKEHASGVMDVFNHYIQSSFAAYAEQPLPEQFFAAMLERIQGYPAYTILNSTGDLVIGFTNLKPWHPFSTFKGTAEITYFIHPRYVGKGVGSLALNCLLADARAMGIRTILASISSLNEPSLSFHKRNGFAECGRFKGVGLKNGVAFDVVWMQLNLK